MTLPLDNEASVTHWLQKVKLGDDDAAARLWNRYAVRLMALARKRLRTVPKRLADEEDVALNAFDSFCRRAKQEGFARLEDRHDLWQLLALITVRKSIDLIRNESRHPLAEDGLGEAVVANLVSEEPTPEMVAMMADQHARLMNRLDEPNLQQVALLRLDGYRDEEIAERIGFTRRTIQRKLHRIRQLLERELG